MKLRVKAADAADPFTLAVFAGGERVDNAIVGRAEWVGNELVSTIEIRQTRGEQDEDHKQEKGNLQTEVQRESRAARR